jgi:hypothetical protein
MEGWEDKYSAIAVVPHLGEPTMKKFGFLIIRQFVLPAFNQPAHKHSAHSHLRINPTLALLTISPARYDTVVHQQKAEKSVNVINARYIGTNARIFEIKLTGKHGSGAFFRLF